jgi:ABC-type molybdenum transport system ATPase subunit/photorepair protein PhrA
MLFIVGPSGSGKTTLLSVISGQTFYTFVFENLAARRGRLTPLRAVANGGPPGRGVG